MSRVSHSNGNETAAANAQHTADAQQKSANAQGARNGAQFAALYRGTTSFTYGQDPQRGPSVSSVRAKKMADQLARKRRAAKKQRGGGAGLDDDGPDEADAHHADSHAVNRDGRGRGGGGQSHDDHSDEHDSDAAPTMKVRKNSGVVPPPTRQLEAIAGQYAEPGQEGMRNGALRDAWCGAMLGLLGQLSASPQLQFAASVMELSMDLLGAQQRFGKLPSLGLSSLRDRSSGASGPGAGVTRLPPPERVQRFNLLFPLLWLHADMPYTGPQRARALDTLGTLRSGTVSRAMTASAGNKPGAQVES
jgi:type III secretion regulatory protein HpaA